MAELNNSPRRDSGKIRSRKMSMRIDMTPMVDLAFLLLTFFILTTTLIRPTAMQVQKPEPDDGTGQNPPIFENNLLTIVLGKDDKVYWYTGIESPQVNMTDFSSNGIRKTLFDKKTEIRKLHVFIKATDQSRYQNFVDILDEMLVTDIKNYTLMDLTEEDARLIAKFDQRVL